LTFFVCILIAPLFFQVSMVCVHSLSLRLLMMLVVNRLVFVLAPDHDNPRVYYVERYHEVGHGLLSDSSAPFFSMILWKVDIEIMEYREQEFSCISRMVRIIIPISRLSRAMIVSPGGVVSSLCLHVHCWVWVQVHLMRVSVLSTFILIGLIKVIVVGY
jgi:hypothetical protein